MNICLVRPPSVISAAAYIGSLTPPIGVAYLAGSLRAAGHNVSIVDAIGEAPFEMLSLDQLIVQRGLSFEKILERIPRNSEIIGFSSMFSSEWPYIRPLLSQIGQKFPQTFLLGGGEHLTAAAELSLFQVPELHAIAMGEGEETIIELANALGTGEPIENISGLAYRITEKVAFSGPRARIRAIDQIPPPAWDLVPLANYLDNGLTYGVNRGRSMPVLASRGCPYQCTFCSNPQMWGTRWIARDTAKLVEEILDYKARYKIKNVDFYDLTAIVKKKWIVEFCQELISRNTEITWQLPSGTRSEAIDGETAQWLYKSGCRNLNYAPESGSRRTLVLIKKKLDPNKLVQSLKSSVKEGLNVKINIILGLPKETHTDVLTTILYLIRLSWHGAHDVSAGAFAPYPGSELYTEIVQSGGIEHTDKYFKKLAYVDISKIESYCERISNSALRRYVWLAFAVFYFSNYLFRPWRAFLTARNVLTRNHNSRGEMALGQLMQRFRFLRSERVRDA